MSVFEAATPMQVTATRLAARDLKHWPVAGIALAVPSRTPFLEPAWLEAWADAYGARNLVLIEISDEGVAVAVGLIEVLSGRRWRFAGYPLSPQRGLRCVDGAERQAWQALAGWLAGSPASWSGLDVAGVPVEDVSSLPGRRVATPVFRLDLPSGFDEYLSSRSPTARKGLKQKLRRAERAQAIVVEVEDVRVEGSLDEFIRLHHLRARAKNERHPAIDRRLTAALLGAAGAGAVGLRVFEMRVMERVVGVTVRLDHLDTGYFYNSGIDPQWLHLSPGVVLELHSIRDATDRGLCHFDLGPGVYRYKSDLGGLREERVHLRLRSGRAPVRTLGRAAELADRGRERLAGAAAAGFSRARTAWRAEPPANSR